MRLPSVCFVIVYIGPWPIWMPLFLESCRYNKGFNWLIFGDHTFSGNVPKNVQFERMSFHRFNMLAKRETGLPFNIKRPYKISDTKEMFGRIFNKYLKGFDFWGQTDVDLVYGDLDSFGIRQDLDKFDIYCPYHAPVGHFTLYKNVEKINNLYQKYDNLEFSYKETESLMGFDEHFLGNLIAISKDIYVKHTDYRKELLKKRCAVGVSIMPYGQILGERLSANERYQFKGGRVFQFKGSKKREFMYLHFFMWKGTRYWRQYDTSKNFKQFWLNAWGFANSEKELKGIRNVERALHYWQYAASRLWYGLRWTYILYIGRFFKREK